MTQDSDTLYCPECNYNLQGSISSRCPECGLWVDAAGLRSVTLPWGRAGSRGHSGRWARTILLAVRRPNEVVGGVNVVLPMRLARRFALSASLAGFILACGSELARTTVSNGTVFGGRAVNTLEHAGLPGEFQYVLSVALSIPGVLALGVATFLAGLPWITVACVGVTLRNGEPVVLHRAVWLAHFSAAGSILLGAAATLYALAMRLLPTILGPFLTASSAGTWQDAVWASVSLTFAIVLALLGLVPLLVLPVWIVVALGGKVVGAGWLLLRMAAWSAVWTFLVITAFGMTPAFARVLWYFMHR